MKILSEFKNGAKAILSAVESYNSTTDLNGKAAEATVLALNLAGIALFTETAIEINSLGEPIVALAFGGGAIAVGGAACDVLPKLHKVNQELYSLKKWRLGR